MMAGIYGYVMLLWYRFLPCTVVGCVCPADFAMGMDQMSRDLAHPPRQVLGQQRQATDIRKDPQAAVGLREGANSRLPAAKSASKPAYELLRKAGPPASEQNQSW